MHICSNNRSSTQIDNTMHAPTKRSTVIILLTLLLTLTNLHTTTARMGVYAYIFYEDATCVNNNQMIEGTFIYAYDNPRMSGKGFTRKNYYGPCKYFDGGFYDFMYGSSSSSSSSGSGKKSSYMKTGYCATCNGMVGCTKTPYNCTDFQSVVPTNAYTLSSSSSSSSSSTSEEDNTNSNYEAMEQSTKNLEKEVYQEIAAASLSNSGSDDSVAIFALLGMLSGLTVLMILYVGMASYKKIRRSKASIDTSGFLEDREHDFEGRGDSNSSKVGVGQHFSDGGGDHDRDYYNDNDVNDIRMNGIIA